MNKIIISIAISLLCSSAAWAGFGDMLKQSAEQYISGDKTHSGSSALSSLSNSEIDAGLKEALSIGAERAVALLGKQGGFLDNPKVRIPLPGALKTVGSALRAAGQGKYVDEFETTVNRAAEEAIPKTLEIVKNTVQNMTLEDVKGILGGADDAATQFLRNNAWDSMVTAVKPIVSKATDQTGATSAYKKLVDSSGSALGSVGSLLGGGSAKSLDLDSYVTDKALDGLFTMLAEEEKKIRENPVARSTDLLKKVFQ